MANKFFSINKIEKALENEFDFDFSINEKYISNIEEFYEIIKEPFDKGGKKIFTGERDLKILKEPSFRQCSEIKIFFLTKMSLL
ncbi:MAG: hypothetical protein LUG21_00045 [Clostridiales bacterium]|nr:hypothetical protein [Clostridiales bacterium]